MNPIKPNISQTSPENNLEVSQSATDKVKGESSQNLDSAPVRATDSDKDYIHVDKEKRIQLPFQVSSHMNGITPFADLSKRPMVGAHNVRAVTRDSLVRYSSLDHWDGTPSHLEQIKAKADARYQLAIDRGFLTPEKIAKNNADLKRLAKITFGFNTFNMSTPKWMKK